MNQRWVRRLPLLLILLVAYVIWRGAFGLFATNRAVVWNLPVEYSAVRRLELQIWQGEELLKREERVYPGGITSELRSEVLLKGGPHRAIVTAWSADGASRTFAVDFDPGEEGTTVLAPKR